MRPKSPEAPTGDLFRNSLEAIIDPGHELIRLAALIDWARFETRSGRITMTARAGPACRRG